MLRTPTFCLALSTLSLLGLGGCSANGADGQVGPMGLPGPAGPVGPMGTLGTTGGSVFDELDLPGTAYYPESLTSAADGTIYVGSLPSLTIMKFPPNTNTAVPFVTTASAGKNINGVLVDEKDKSLLACANDFSSMTFQPYVIRFNLADGSEKAKYQFPAVAACNDMAFDGQHNLYVTDSYGKIYILKDGSQALAQWSADPALVSAMAAMGGFGADGIAWDGGANMYVNTFTDNTFMRLPIDPNTGAAGAAVPITVTPALSSPDALRYVAPNTFLIVEGAGRLTRLTISGTTATGVSLSNRLDAPTSVTMVGTNYWVSEGQLPHFFGINKNAPNIPFLIRRVPNF